MTKPVSFQRHSFQSSESLRLRDENGRPIHWRTVCVHCRAMFDVDAPPVLLNAIECPASVS